MAGSKAISGQGLIAAAGLAGRVIDLKPATASNYKLFIELLPPGFKSADEGLGGGVVELHGFSDLHESTFTSLMPRLS